MPLLVAAGVLWLLVGFAYASLGAPEAAAARSRPRSGTPPASACTCS
jgi:hypothetical protein